ncbi:MAG: response regulator [Candidatus Moraniibacteriota bacterium]|nr:MAG: response regulator [Candidatus Moranbacteria bacterium]
MTEDMTGVAPQGNGMAGDAKRTALLLVAEDDQFYANLYRTKLEKEGFGVVTAANGKETLELLKQHSPNLIILDLVMPEMDGFEVLKKIKEEKNLRDVPVIILSNLGQQEDIDRAQALGVFKYIVKSNVSIHQMVESVEEALTSAAEHAR